LFEFFRVAEIVKIFFEEVEAGQIEVASCNTNFLALGDNSLVNVFESVIRVIYKRVKRG